MEKSLFWTTGSSGDGTNPISEAYTTEWHRSILTPRSGATNAPNTTQGVLRGVLNELAVSGTASPVSVAAGGAVVAGYYYLNDAALTVAIPTPAANTRIDRIVLRASHGTTRTVRITRIAGTEGTGSAPALTQTAGTTWDIPLATVSITTGGVITVTDGRTLAQYATNHVKRDGDTMTGSLVVTHTDGVRINGGLATLDQYNPSAPSAQKGWRSAVNASGTLLFQTLSDAYAFAANWLGVTRSGTTVTQINFEPGGDVLKSGGNPVLHTGNMALRVVTAWIADLSVTAGKLAANAVTLAKLEHPPRRQGGNATNWGILGTTNYTPASMRMQFGVAETTLSTSTVTVTFPVAFSNVPLVFAHALGGVFLTDIIALQTVSATQVTLVAYVNESGDGAGVRSIQWLALGPA